jgi:hypothetical protein
MRANSANGPENRATLAQHRAPRRMVLCPELRHAILCPGPIVFDAALMTGGDHAGLNGFSSEPVFVLTIDFAAARRSISFLTIVEFVETEMYSIIDEGWSQGANSRQIYYSLCYFVTREYREPSVAVSKAARGSPERLTRGRRPSLRD